MHLISFLLKSPLKLTEFFKKDINPQDGESKIGVHSNTILEAEKQINESKLT